MQLPIVSYGIACCRKSTNGKYEILMIKKKSTYSFAEFVRGSYNINQKHNIIYLLDNMSIDEKISINSLNYNILWLKLYGKLPCQIDNKNYTRGLKKYNALIEINNGQYLLEMLKYSGNKDILWEIPKGRQDKNESNLEAAIREFQEETNIPKNEYKILFNEKCISYTFFDNGKKYTYIYYLGIMLNNKYEPKFHFNSANMIREVLDIKFLSKEQIRLFNNNRLHNIVKVIIKKVKKYI